MEPSSVTVGLVRSVWTIKRMPLGSVTSDGWSRAAGTRKDLTEASAQSGKATGLVGVVVVFSEPPKPFDSTASPEGEGLRVPMIGSSTKYFLAARFTSA